MARHEGWRLSRQAAREAAPDELPAGEAAEALPWAERIPDRRSLESQLEARWALASLLALRPRERRYMTLRVAGYSYREICELTGASYTNVNKHLTRARSRLRSLREGFEPAG